jgi:argininosuccinate lyase
MSKLWGARFSGKSDALADKFTFSIAYDYRLAQYDCVGSIAHALMLGKQGIIPKSDAQKIVSGLTKILNKIKSGQFKFDATAEDIHTNIQQELKRSIGAAADRLHTARSRNDQVVLDVKLYCIDHIDHMVAAITLLQKSILGFARRNATVIIPAYTHLQGAQVVLLAHHMLAYIEMIERDKTRLQDAFMRLNTLPLGSCALSGTSLKIDRQIVAKTLGFKSIALNSMDVVSSRDFISEIIFVCAQNAVHLSRISEDLILWATKEFDFVDIDASMCTGSSIMPHKKNPDVLELLRGASAQLIANSNAILTLQKGLSLTYNRDLQLDKPPLFSSIETTENALAVLAKLFTTLKVKQDKINARIHDESFFSVDVMDYLICKGVSYRDAHDILGRLVKDCLDHGKKISTLSLKELKVYSSSFSEDVKKLFNPKMSVTIKTSLGSTNPKRVSEQMQLWSKKLHA